MMKRAGRQDVQRLAMRRTLHDLRQSIAAGRPISLPNLLRLLRRRMAEASPPQIQQQSDRLRHLYMKKQPFREG